MKVITAAQLMQEPIGTVFVGNCWAQGLRVLRKVSYRDDGSPFDFYSIALLPNPGFIYETTEPPGTEEAWSTYDDKEAFVVYDAHDIAGLSVVLDYLSDGDTPIERLEELACNLDALPEKENDGQEP